MSSYEEEIAALKEGQGVQQDDITSELDALLNEDNEDLNRGEDLTQTFIPELPYFRVATSALRRIAKIASNFPKGIQFLMFIKKEGDFVEVGFDNKDNRLIVRFPILDANYEGDEVFFVSPEQIKRITQVYPSFAFVVAEGKKFLAQDARFTIELDRFDLGKDRMLHIPEVSNHTGDTYSLKGCASEFFLARVFYVIAQKLGMTSFTFGKEGIVGLFSLFVYESNSNSGVKVPFSLRKADVDILMCLDHIDNIEVGIIGTDVFLSGEGWRYLCMSSKELSNNFPAPIGEAVQFTLDKHELLSAVKVIGAKTVSLDFISEEGVVKVVDTKGTYSVGTGDFPDSVSVILEIMGRVIQAFRDNPTFVVKVHQNMIELDFSDASIQRRVKLLRITLSNVKRTVKGESSKKLTAQYDEKYGERASFKNNSIAAAAGVNVAEIIGDKKGNAPDAPVQSEADKSTEEYIKSGAISEKITEAPVSQV